MSSGCGDVLSLEDLKTAKLHQVFEAEVITGLSGGAVGGASIDYATNQVTGQVQKTLPAILRDLGYEPASFDFASGGTLTVNDRNKAVLWPISSGGDGDYYYWQGALPKVIPATSTPSSTGGVAVGAWRPVGDISLRTQLASTASGLGDALVGVKQSFASSRVRTQHDVNNDFLSSNIWLDANSVADQSTAFVNMVTEAAGRRIRLAAGTYFVSGTFTADLNIEGEGVGLSVIRRPTTATAFLTWSGTGTLRARGITFDGNKANNSNPSDSFIVGSTVTSLDIEGCRFTGAKSGNGLRVGSDNSLKVSTGIRRACNNIYDNNDNFGARITRVDNLSFTGNEGYQNGDNGLSVDFVVFPPVAGAQKRINVSGNRMHDNTSAGIFVTGFIEGGTASAPLYGVASNANFNVLVTDNHIYNNKRYGLAVQSNGAVVDNNICQDNGSYTDPIGSAYAGILINGSNLTCNNNICRGNSGYGMDLGGSQYFTCNNNVVMENATAAGGGYIGINLGACQYGTINGNTVGLNGPAAYGVQILAPGYDGGGTSFQTLTNGLTINGNNCILGSGSSRVGIKLYGRPLNCVVSNNTCHGGTSNSAVAIETNEPVQVFNNSHEAGNNIALLTLANSPALTFPDYVETVRVSGGGSITNFLTYSHNIYRNKVSEAVVSNPGSGYNPIAPPTVTISGGGGSGATAVAAVDGSGKIISVNIVNAGSGYTTTPTITIAAPVSGVTAVAAARIGVVNFQGRKWTLYFDTASTLTSINNIFLPSSPLSVPAGGTVTFLGTDSGLFVLAGKSF